MPEPARRLWQLDASAHDLLLGLSFAPDSLRDLLARTLGRLHRARCVLNGSDADVLYSVVRDLKARNPLSEALHRALQQRHAVEAARWRRLRGAPALRQAWSTALAADGKTPPVAALWALLTHPDGAELEQAVLYDARQRAWTLAQQAAQGWQRAAQAEQAAAGQRQQAEALQQRLTALQQAQARLQQQLLVAQAEARGADRRAQAAERAAAGATPLPVAAEPSHRLVLAAALPSPAAGASAAVPTDGDRAFDPGANLGADAAHEPSPPAPALDAEALALVAPTAAKGAPPPAAAPAVAGRRVLCVGGMPGTRQRYRALLEAAGARFEYHDGGLEDGIARLDSQLQAADVVVCHSGCLNHEAYRRIKLHCQRGDKPCVYLARPSLSTFARGLGLPARLGDSMRTASPCATASPA